MPNFDHQPPPDLGRSGFRLIRTPATRALLAHVLSDRLIGCNTHFVGNRTIPCEKPTCPSCQSGVSWRWHAYLAVILDATQETVIFETTAKASEAFVAYYERHGTCRGAHIKAQRVNGKHNGRVVIQCKPADLAKVHLPQSPHVDKILCHIWNISEQQVNKSPKMARPPADDISVDRTTGELKLPKRIDCDPLVATLPTDASDGNGRDVTLPFPPK